MAIEEISDSFNTVYKPEHYASNEIEVIDFIEQVVKDYPADESYLIGSVLKYIARSPHKGTKGDDLKKAHNFLHRVIYKEWYK